MKKVYLIIMVCLFGGIMLVVLLFSYEKIVKEHNNAFIRTYPPHMLNSLRYIDTKFNSYYFAGLSQKQIYLGNYNAPKHILIIDNNLNKGNTLNLDIPKKPDLNVSTTQIRIDSPYVYMVDYLKTEFLKGTLGKPLAYLGRLDSHQFSSWIGLSNNTFVLYTYSNEYKQRALFKTKKSDMKYLSKYLLEKQMDGLFSVDGMLHYNQKSKHLIYIYYYRNQILCLDTNLNIIYKAKTIDTNSLAKIKISSISSSKVTTFSAPPFFVNKKSFVSIDKIYIQSDLKADNDIGNIFETHTVIDVYNLQNGKYNYSFKMPKFKGQKLKSFAVTHKAIVALYDHYLVSWNLKYF